MSKITLIGFNNYLNDELFSKLTLPDGIEKETLIDTILLKGGEFEVLWSSPSFMEDAIGVWGKKWFRTFDRWVKALNIEYNPLENYDRAEEWNTTNNDQSTSNSAATHKNESDSTSKVLDKVSAYDSEDLSNKSSSDNSGKTITSSDLSNQSSDTSKRNETRAGRIHGNIGVTTSQQMLESELEIARWNLYDHIADVFLEEFTIMIY